MPGGSAQQGLLGGQHTGMQHSLYVGEIERLVPYQTVNDVPMYNHVVPAGVD